MADYKQTKLCAAGSKLLVYKSKIANMCGLKEHVQQNGSRSSLDEYSYHLDQNLQEMYSVVQKSRAIPSKGKRGETLRMEELHDDWTGKHWQQVL